MGPWAAGLRAWGLLVEAGARLGRVRSAAPVHTSALRHAVGMQKEHLAFGGQAHHEVLVGMRGMTRMLRETSLLDPDLSLLVFSHLNKFKKNLSKIPRASVQLHIRVYYVDSIIFHMLNKNMFYALLLGPAERTLMLKSRKQF
ncbi:hypothetical protein CFC21_065093 [Triticum aestivum]|uniref:Uncharacterized protein n=3 Tax=Triticum TaxID=4564 RepID=A0A9R0WL03_TRITD|nr:hypothetical protein CFC21_065093 [Triticum aestivum]VAI15587.1 unnamed protein product [Triticum turgidum subsp. durum]